MQENECRALLLALLDDSGVKWVQNGDWTRFRFQKDGMLWETACKCGQDEVLAYARFPFDAFDRTAALAACNAANSRLLQGGIFLSGSAPVYRLRADLRDPYGARERLAQALEYSAAAVTRFWGLIQPACHRESAVISG